MSPAVSAGRADMIESPPSALSNAMPYAQKNKIFAQTANRNIAQTDTIPTANIGLALPVHPLKKDPCGDKKNMLSDTRHRQITATKPSHARQQNHDHNNKTDAAQSHDRPRAATTPGKYDRRFDPTSARTAADPTMHGRRSSYARSPIRIHTMAKPSKHSRKFKHAPQI